MGVSVTSDPSQPVFPGFDPQGFVSMMTRAFQGPEQAIRVYRELMGLEGGSRERAVDFMAQLARGYGMDATPMFEGVLRFHPSSTARVAAAAYLVDQGRDETVLEVLESLQPPVITITLLSGLLDVLSTRPLTPERLDRLLSFAGRFSDNERYTTLYLGDFSGRDVKRIVRRAIAEGLLRREAPAAADWPRE